MGPGGDIFWSDDAGTRRTLRFEEAFPEIASLIVDVIEEGHGNAGLGPRRFSKRSIREFVNCSSEHCSGKGVAVGQLLRAMVRDRRPRLHVEKPCQSRHDSGAACPNVFDIRLELEFQTPDPRESRSPFGVLAFLHWHHPWNTNHFPPALIPRAAALLKQAGVGMARMDFLWSDIEPQRKTFEWTRYDAIVDAVCEQGLSLVGILNYNPGWVDGGWNQAPDVSAYLAYAHATVRHFKDRIRYWEVWNEPDHPSYWQPQDGLKAYCELLRAASAEIKSVDPSALVLLGGLSQNIPENLQVVYERAGPASFDVVNIHPFANPLHADALEFVRRTYAGSMRVMRANGDGDKPLWITELGCPGVPRAAPTRSWWLGEAPDESQQADWLRTVYRNVTDWPNVERVFWAFFRDTPAHFGDAVDYFGLVREDLSTKPAFTAYQALALKSANGERLS